MLVLLELLVGMVAANYVHEYVAKLTACAVEICR